ncbi:MAG: hypothetical protein EOO75_20470, partial [Myxococcales bacterium]
MKIHRVVLASLLLVACSDSDSATGDPTGGRGGSRGPQMAWATRVTRDAVIGPFLREFSMKIHRVVLASL